MRWRFVCAWLLIWTAAAPPTSTAQESYDLVIRGGRLLDGSGSPWFYADLAISGDRIAAVGDLEGARARRYLDASGLYVAPGFMTSTRTRPAG